MFEKRQREAIEAVEFMTGPHNRLADEEASEDDNFGPAAARYLADNKTALEPLKQPGAHPENRLPTALELIQRCKQHIADAEAHSGREAADAEQEQAGREICQYALEVTGKAEGKVNAALAWILRIRSRQNRRTHRLNPTTISNRTS